MLGPRHHHPEPLGNRSRRRGSGRLHLPHPSACAAAGDRRVMHQLGLRTRRTGRGRIDYSAECNGSTCNKGTRSWKVGTPLSVTIQIFRFLLPDIFPINLTYVDIRISIV